MTTYNLDAVAGGVLSERIRPQLAMRWERHYNIIAQAGLAVGDILQADIPVPNWVRTIVVSKRTNTANADTLTVQCQDAALPIAPVLPIKTANAIQTSGSSSNSASNTILMQLYPVGDFIRVLLTIATSIPAQGVLSIAFYDV